MREAGVRHVEQLVGISLDEYQRMRDSDVGYITNVYPLVERKMTRADCVTWLEDHYYPVPRKSSCIACPLRSTSWADAVEFDTLIRESKRGTGGRHVYVHRSATPLERVEMRTAQEQGQLDMFDGCGVLCTDEST